MMQLTDRKRESLKLAFKKTRRGIVTRVALILLAILIATLFLVVSGYEANGIFRGIARSITKDFGGTIKTMIALLVTSLAVCIPFKMGMFNLGVDGQYYMGAMFCIVFSLQFPNMSRIFGIPTLFIIGGIGGMLWALIPALMKIYFHADEVVSTLLLNFVAELITQAVILGPLKAPDITNSSAYVSEAYFLTPVLRKANSGIYIAIVLAIVLAVVMSRTTFGYELRISGENPNFAKYGGIKARKSITLSMAISGFISGMAGVIMMLGVLHRFPNLFNAVGIGFTGVVVAILANNSPIACIFAAFFFACLTNGMTNMQRLTDIPASISDIVQAIIVLTTSGTLSFPYIKRWISRYKKDKVPANSVRMEVDG